MARVTLATPPSSVVERRASSSAKSGDAVGALDDAVGDRPIGHDGADEGESVVRRQAVELERVADRRLQRFPSRGHYDELGTLAAAGCQGAHEGEGAFVGPMEVLEDDQVRALGVAPGHEVLESVDDVAPVLPRRMGQRLALRIGGAIELDRELDLVIGVGIGVERALERASERLGSVFERRFEFLTDPAEQRIIRARLVFTRAGQKGRFQPGAAERRAELVQQAALAHAGVALERERSALATPGRPPGLAEDGALVETVEERRRRMFEGAVGGPGRLRPLPRQFEDAERALDADQRAFADVDEIELEAGEFDGGVADQNFADGCDRLQPSGDVGGLADDGGGFGVAPAPEIGDHDQAAMDADAHRHREGELEPGHRQRFVQPGDRALNAEGGGERPPGVVLAGERVAEIGEQTVAEILPDRAFELLDRAGAHFAESHDDGVEVFGLNLGGKPGRADQIAENDGQEPLLTDFGAGWLFPRRQSLVGKRLAAVTAEARSARAGAVATATDQGWQGEHRASLTSTSLDFAPYCRDDHIAIHASACVSLPLA